MIQLLATGDDWVSSRVVFTERKFGYRKIFGNSLSTGSLDQVRKPFNHVCVREEKDLCNWLSFDHSHRLSPMVPKSSNARLSPIPTRHFLSLAIKELVMDANFRRLRMRLIYSIWFTKLRVSCHLVPLLGFFVMWWCCCYDASCWFFQYSMLKFFFCVDLNRIARYQLRSLGIPETTCYSNLLRWYVIFHN